MTFPPLPYPISAPGPPPMEMNTSNLQREYTERTTPPKTNHSTLAKAGSRALKRMGKVIGDTKDPDVAFYESLSQADFGRLTNAYGTDAVGSYVKTMEQLRLNRS